MNLHCARGEEKDCADNHKQVRVLVQRACSAFSSESPRAYTVLRTRREQGEKRGVACGGVHQAARLLRKVVDEDEKHQVLKQQKRLLAVGTESEAAREAGQP